MNPKGVILNSMVCKGIFLTTIVGFTAQIHFHVLYTAEGRGREGLNSLCCACGFEIPKWSTLWPTSEISCSIHIVRQYPINAWLVLDRLTKTTEWKTKWNRTIAKNFPHLCRKEKDNTWGWRCQLGLIQGWMFQIRNRLEEWVQFLGNMFHSEKRDIERAFLGRKRALLRRKYELCGTCGGKSELWRWWAKTRTYSSSSSSDNPDYKHENHQSRQHHLNHRLSVPNQP